MDEVSLERLLQELRETRRELQRLANQMTQIEHRLIDIIIRLLREVELR